MTKSSLLKSREENYYAHPRFDIMGYIPKNVSKVLDVGCGEGEFCKQLKENNGQLETWGVEVNQEAGKIAQSNMDNVLIGNVEEMLDEIPGEYFDCVTFNDSLEHLVDPFQFLIKLKTKLANNGIVICSIPNMRYFRVLRDLVLKKQWHYREGGILDRTHLHFFTEQSIKDMFQDLGYKVLALEGLRPRNSTLLFLLLNFFSFGLFSDTRYPLFVCVAQPEK